jgi:hypothetical protein
MEHRGIPVATVITTAFQDSAFALRRMQGLETLPIILIPHPLAARQVEEVRRKAQEAFPEILAAVTQCS